SPPAPPPPPAAAAAPEPPPPLRTLARLRYRCFAGARRVPTGARQVAVRRGVRLVCRGSTVPALRRARLEVQRLVKGRWTRVGTASTTATGRFGFAVRLRTPGRWTIRAAVAATPSRAASAGPRARLMVARRR
ncbi:MAG TPA: hypothetical protein VK904_07475, partial [Miltoncostaeaceae bacterium]|nr:hypothetical protein [Miltoncostaeaceae bacterium]